MAIPLAIAVAFLVVLTAAGLGMRVPGLSFLPPFGSPAQLDYGAGPREPLAPLDQGYLTGVLGSPASPGAGPAGAVRSASGALFAGGRSGGPPVRTLEHAFTNDDFGDAVGIADVPFTARTDTTRASFQPGEPSDCNPRTTAWYRYRAVRDARLVANTFGSNYATSLAVYSGTALGRLREVGRCDADLRGNAFVPFTATQGTVYFFQVGATVNGGTLVFTLEPEGAVTRLSSSATGAPGDADSGTTSVSSDGRLVAFDSYARNLDTDARPCAVRAPQSGIDEVRENPWPQCSGVYVVDRTTGRTRLASVASDGDPADGDADHPYISGNGRFVAFRSNATDLVPGDTNAAADVFVHDLRTGRTERVSLTWQGGQSQPVPDTHGTSSVDQPSMSADGRYVAFVSTASDLVPHDGNRSADVFVRDRVRGTTERVSVDSAGREQQLTLAAPGASGQNQRDAVADSSGLQPSISLDGRYVVFHSTAPNLVAGDTNGYRDVFVHDRRTGRTERVSVSSMGQQGDDNAEGSDEATRPLISADGRYVVFCSEATNMIDNRDDDNGSRDVFVRDRSLGRTYRASVSSTGEPAGQSYSTGYASISANGRWVLFGSNAPNLAPGSIRDQNAFPVLGAETEIYVHDLWSHRTERLPLDNSLVGNSPNTAFGFPSADGQVIAFTVFCGDKSCGSPDVEYQVYVHERHRQ
jgi:Tol biopolymer transport system component